MPEPDSALRRRIDTFLRTADAAMVWLSPAERRLTLDGSDSTPRAFADCDSAADWSEREQHTFDPLVREAVSGGLDRLAWQLAETVWHAWPRSTSRADWVNIGRVGLAAAEREGDTGGRIRLLISLGTAYRAANRLDDGLRSLARALELCRDSGNALDEAHALNLIGLLHLRARRLDSATSCFDSALATFRELGEEHWTAVVLSNIASTCLNAGPAADAREAVEQALTAHRALGNRQSEGNALRIAAAMHIECGEPDEAEQAVRDALVIAADLRDRTLEAYWLITLGDVQRVTAAYGDALIAYQRSADLHRRLGDRHREALAWRGAGLTYEALDRLTEAAAFHRRAAAVHADLGDAWEHALDLAHLADALHSRDPEPARTHWTQSLACLTPFTDPRADAVRARIEHHLARTR
ncbi:tetratricopeptide repeat protein [Streptomyces sp. NBC_00433]